MYWEPAKYVARLRTLKTDAKPLLLKINMDAAATAASPGRYDRLREVAFDYAFLLTQLGLAALSRKTGLETGVRAPRFRLISEVETAGTRCSDTGFRYMWRMTASPNSVHFTSFAPSIRRAKS